MINVQRVEKVRAYLKEKGIDGFLVTYNKHLRYLAGFTGSAGVVVITLDKAYFITDFRYREQAKEQAQGFEVVIHQGLIYNEVKQLLEVNNIAKLAIEADDMNVSTYIHLKDLLSVELVETQNVIETIRAIKEPEEIEIIRQACEISDQAFEHILTFIKPGVTEIEVANELERFHKEKGAEGMSFDTIIASGLRSAMPHGRASEKVIEAGDLVTLDFGCYYKGYSSDMTRTVAVGPVSPQLKEIYDIVLEAHNRVIQGAKAGMSGKEIDCLARDYISEKGYGDAFGHSTGHGLGLDVHEMPAVAMKNEKVIQENMVITDEPGIYLPGVGGVRIEDDLLVHADGVESLNRSPKHLIIL